MIVMKPMIIPNDIFSLFPARESCTHILRTSSLLFFPCFGGLACLVMYAHRLSDQSFSQQEMLSIMLNPDPHC